MYKLAICHAFHRVSSKAICLQSRNLLLLLFQVLERVIPMLSRTQLAEVQRELVETCTGILAILVTANPALFASFVKGFLQVLEGAAAGYRGGLRMYATVLCLMRCRPASVACPNSNNLAPGLLCC